nr:PASTA domain-containing protein [Thermoleophilaceae bacterium]
DVLELSQERAAAEINGVGLNAEVREKRTENEDEDGTVLVQRPPPGSERERGRTVVILVGRFESPDGESLIE